MTERTEYNIMRAVAWSAIAAVVLSSALAMWKILKGEM